MRVVDMRCGYRIEGWRWVVASCVVVATSLVARPASAQSDPCDREYVRKTVELVNEVRRDQGLEKVRCHRKLTEVAEAHSRDQCQWGKMSHRGSNGSRFPERYRAGEVKFRMGAENVARGARTARRTHRQWMTSKGHRRNILTPEYRRIGVGFVECENGRYWTQNFAGPYGGDNQPTRAADRRRTAQESASDGEPEGNQCEKAADERMAEKDERVDNRDEAAEETAADGESDGADPEETDTKRAAGGESEGEDREEAEDDQAAGDEKRADGREEAEDDRVAEGETEADERDEAAEKRAAGGEPEADDREQRERDRVAGRDEGGNDAPFDYEEFTEGEFSDDMFDDDEEFDGAIRFRADGEFDSEHPFDGDDPFDGDKPFDGEDPVDGDGPFDDE